MQHVIVSGYWGEGWLSNLYPSNVGPSSTEYVFDSAELVETYPDGSALVRTISPTGEKSRARFHVDGQECPNYPCSQEHTQHTICNYKYRKALVPAGSWRHGGRGIVNAEGWH